MDDMMTTSNQNIYVFTGNGKGKTTSALGLALEAAFNQKKVLIYQFIKGHVSSEIEALKQLEEFIHVKQFGLGFLKNATPSQKHIDVAQAGMNELTDHINAGVYDMIILDEANVAIKYGLISEHQLFYLMDIKPPSLILVITGRYATPGIIQRSDHAVEMVSVKHYYQKGIRARLGIEK